MYTWYTIYTNGSILYIKYFWMEKTTKTQFSLFFPARVKKDNQNEKMVDRWSGEFGWEIWLNSINAPTIRMARPLCQPLAATARKSFPWSILCCTVRMCWWISDKPSSSSRPTVMSENNNNNKQTLLIIFISKASKWQSEIIKTCHDYTTRCLHCVSAYLFILHLQTIAKPNRVSQQIDLPDPKSQTADWCRTWWLVCLGFVAWDAPRRFCTHLPCIHWHFRNPNRCVFRAVCLVVPTKLCATLSVCLDSSTKKKLRKFNSSGNFSAIWHKTKTAVWTCGIRSNRWGNATTKLRKILPKSTVTKFRGKNKSRDENKSNRSSRINRWKKSERKYFLLFEDHILNAMAVCVYCMRGEQICLTFPYRNNCLQCRDGAAVAARLIQHNRNVAVLCLMWSAPPSSNRIQQSLCMPCVHWERRKEPKIQISMALHSRMCALRIKLNKLMELIDFTGDNEANTIAFDFAEISFYWLGLWSEHGKYLMSTKTTTATMTASNQRFV